MATLTIKNIPEPLVRRLKAQAARNRRSLNLEVIHRLEASAGSVPVDAAAMLARVRAARVTPVGLKLDNRMIDRWKRQGRP